MLWWFLRVALASLLLAGSAVAAAQQVPVRSLGRFDGWRENALVGYGIVTGLAGSGDSRRNRVTSLALRNVLSRLGTSVSEDDISSRNVAVVIVTASLPASANVGDRLDVNVSSIGDARSLAGGTLLMTPLMGPDQQIYALAQGPLLIGGYRFESNLNDYQRNHPTSGRLVGGATVERSVDASIIREGGDVAFLLSNPDFATAQQIADRVNQRFGAGSAWVQNADEVRLRFDRPTTELASFAATVEALMVEPPGLARVVINERTGTVVASANVRISPVVISQGDIRVSVETHNDASQPVFYAGLASDVGSLVITNTRLNVDEGAEDATATFGNTTIGDLVQGLARMHVDTRRITSILQAMRAAGALHADIIVQ